jgi:poly-gamma-glutamate capsule biosynthesis protein CapA/YwtB (metallophosphatase superfamily)
MSEGSPPPDDTERVTLFLCGDVMTGRGIDQILPHPNRPELHEPYVRDARDYVSLAERANGAIPRPVEPAYIWGDALDALEAPDAPRPDARIINLETSVTRHDEPWPDKLIHYRMHPDNVACLTAARLDVCVLANNHVLDYGHAGLDETLQTLRAAGMQAAGAGRDLAAAQRPACVDLPGGRRLLLFAFGTESSGIPPEWAATTARAGVNLLPDLSDATADQVSAQIEIARTKQHGDLVIASIHWGGNWGYDVPAEHVRFAHRLIDAGVALIHGHSSHHPRPIEIYRDKLVLYGCGDLINDYEGISGYEEFRGDLALMYCPTIDARTGDLAALWMTPMRMTRMRLTHASPEEARWLDDTIRRISQPYGWRG